MDFKDLPKSWVKEMHMARELVGGMEEEQIRTEEELQSAAHKAGKNATDGGTTPADCGEVYFEARLCRWLNECLQHNGVPAIETRSLYKLLNEKHDGMKIIANSDLTKKLEDDICQFVQYFGVTHYVSAIEMGGMYFSILTEKEYERKISLSGNASLNCQLYGGLEQSFKQTENKKSKSQHMERKMIGRITKTGNREVVEKENEAVIGCQLQPISSLVKHPYIQLAVKKAVKEYTKTKISSK